MQKFEQLQQLRLFEHVPSEQLARWAELFIPRRYEREERLRSEGSSSSRFIFLLDGCVKATKWRDEQRQFMVDVFMDHQPPGNMSVYLEQPCPVSVTALDDTITLEVHRNHLVHQFEEHPKLWQGVFRQMLAENRKMLRRLHEMAAAGAERRLAMLFARLAFSVGRRTRLEDGTMGVRVALPLSRGDIAELMNVRHETAIRYMSRWNKEGPVRTDTRGFTIVDYDKLQQLAGEADKQPPAYQNHWPG